MKKNEIKDFGPLMEYARGRAAKSLKRNDPWAWAYWQETAHWAELVITNGRLEYDDSVNCLSLTYPPNGDPEKLYEYTKFLVQVAEGHVAKREYAQAAREYSRAKWMVILARNNGWKMDPKKTGVNLGWLRGFEAAQARKILSVCSGKG